LLAEGLRERYGIHARAEGQEFVIERVDDARRLPTYQEKASPIEAREAEMEHGTQNTPPSSCDLSDLAVRGAVQAIIDRLQLELKVIEKTGFLSYFLIVGDFIRFGHDKGIACVARGSAAGSIVTYLLEISNVDPIRYGLLFERFLNPERVITGY